jgi:hypothetical protein
MLSLFILFHFYSMHQHAWASNFFILSLFAGFVLLRLAIFENDAYGFVMLWTYDKRIQYKIF